MQALATQADVHRSWGGVVPTLAMEAHAAAIDDTVTAALEQAGICTSDLAAVAVTVGPGLSMCLQVTSARFCYHSHISKRDSDHDKDAATCCASVKTPTAGSEAITGLLDHPKHISLVLPLIMSQPTSCRLSS